MDTKILCPFHEDTNPSLHVYSDGYFCFVCYAAGPLSKLAQYRDIGNFDPKPKVLEDLESRRSYIKNLPIGEFRGFKFPYDEQGFYICWADSNYYTCRLFDPEAKCKYLKPKGWATPIFWAQRIHSPILFIVEGELNAISVALAIPNLDVCSFGSASAFNSQAFINSLTEIKKYSTIILIVDKDAAGTLGAIAAKSKLQQYIPTIYIVLMEKDANDTIQQYGLEKLKEIIIDKVQQGL